MSRAPKEQNKRYRDSVSGYTIVTSMGKLHAWELLRKRCLEMNKPSPLYTNVKEVEIDKYTKWGELKK